MNTIQCQSSDKAGKHLFVSVAMLISHTIIGAVSLIVTGSSTRVALCATRKIKFVSLIIISIAMNGPIS